MNQTHFNTTKGQSAIEYLMTYGWMLLVVAIVGGAIFATVQGQCTQSTSGFTGGDVIVENFGIDNNNQTQMTIRNGGSDQLTLDNVSVVNPDGEDQYLSPAPTEAEVDVAVGSSTSITLDEGIGLTSAGGCNDFDVDVRYDMGQLDNQTVSGTLTDSIEFSGNSLP